MAAGEVTQLSGEEARPLSGVRVLDMVTGPMAAVGRHFVELGADVLRLEPVEGAPDRDMGRQLSGVAIAFATRNLGKRSAPLDRFDSLVAGADILLAPLGTIDPEALREAYPALVILTVSDFGNTGRFTRWAGSDAVFHALSGNLSRSGIPGGVPLLPPGELAITCGAVQAVYAAMVAYWRALQSGDGDHLDFSALDGATQSLDPGYGIAGSAAAGIPASQMPRDRPEARFRYPIFPCKDGFVRFCVLAPRQWQGMFEWMGRPREFSDPSFDTLQTRFASRELLPAMARLVAGKTRAQIEEEGQRHGVPAAGLLTFKEVLNNPQFEARRAFASVQIAPGITVPIPDGLMEVDGVRMGVTGLPPGLPDPRADWATAQLARGDDTVARPLEALKVLDLGVIVVGAETGRLLADQGADVIKVESSAAPDGSRQSAVPGPISATFVAGHRNKRSLGIDLRDAKGKALLVDLVRQSDVLLSNFKGGTLRKLGLDHASLTAVNPRIIVIDSSAFGPNGPWSTRMGYGPLVRASAGLTLQWRYPEEPDSFSDAVTVYPDHVAGRIGAIGVIALLIRRLRTGLGGQVGISQAEVMLDHMGPQIAAEALERSGHDLSGRTPQSDVYRCAGDDEWCVVTVRDEADERAIGRVTQGLSLRQWLESRDSRQAMEALQEAGVPAGAMLRVAELPDFAYYDERGFFRREDHPHLASPITVEGPIVRSDRLPDPPMRPAPLLGEHSIDLLIDRLGMPMTEIDKLREAKIIEQAGSLT